MGDNAPLEGSPRLQIVGFSASWAVFEAPPSRVTDHSTLANERYKSIMSDSIKTTNEATPDQDSGTVRLNAREFALIIAIRTKDYVMAGSAFADLVSGTPPADKPTAPPELQEDAFYRLSVGVTAMLFHDWIMPEEFYDRFNFADMHQCIDAVIRSELLEGAVDDYDLNKVLEILDYQRRNHLVR